MKSWLQDLRYGIRLYRKSPGFTAVAILTLALGIGATTTIFSVIYAVLLRPLPYTDPGQLVIVWETQLQRNLPFMYLSPPNFNDVRAQNDIFKDLAAFDTRNAFLKQGEEQIRVTATRTTSSLFPLLGVQPHLGRWFYPSEDQPGSERTVVLGHSFWKDRFASDPHIAGKQIIINHESYIVAGVMPETFHFPPPIMIEGAIPDPETDIWISFAENPATGQRSAHYLTVLARLKPGVTLERAKSGLQLIGNRLEAAYPESNSGWNLTVIPLKDQVQGSSRAALYSLFGAVGFVLLIACVNVANLLLARGASRQKEYAIRTAVGAGRMRLFRQIVLENLLIAALGCVTALALSYWGIQLIQKFGPSHVPRLNESELNGIVALFAAAVSMVSGLLCGFAPALQSISPDQFTWLRESGNSAAERPGKTHFRKILVIVEVSLALVLLIGAGLLFQSFLKLTGVNAGFQVSEC